MKKCPNCNGTGTTGTDFVMVCCICKGTGDALKGSCDAKIKHCEECKLHTYDFSNGEMGCILDSPHLIV